MKAYCHTYKPNILAITKTNLSDDFDDNERLGANYTILQNDRKKGGGGVLFAVDNSLGEICITNQRQGPGESITTTIQLCHQIIFNIIVFYRPPHETQLDNLEELLVNNPSQHYNIMIGDLNLPDITWHNNKGEVASHSKRRAFHQRALDLIQLSNMKQLIHEPTHIAGKTLDLVLVAKNLFDDIKVDCEVLPKISDHNMIEITINHPESTSKPSKSDNIRYNFAKADYRLIDANFVRLSEHLHEHPNQSVESMWKNLDTCIKTSLQMHVPTYRCSHNDKPWFNRSLKRLINKSKRAFQLMKNEPYSYHIKKEKDISRQIKSEVRRLKADFLANHITDNLENGNSKPLFAHIKRSRGQSSHINRLKDTPNDLIATKLADYFAQVYNSHKYVPPEFSCEHNHAMPKIKISQNGVKTYLLGLDPRKATGPDDISPATLKHFATHVPVFSEVITYIFQKSIERAEIPEIWRKAVVTPIYKGGPRDQVSNYRPVSITSILCKCLEHIICSNIWDHIDNNKLLSDAQHGFRKGFSTTTQLLHVVHNATEALDKNASYHIVSFDFAKAFDKVPHDLLLLKLRAYKIDKQACDWIESWLTNRVSVVSANGQRSDEFQVLSGVPQGSVLGPVLFLLFIEDMPHSIKHSDCRLYADDTLLCCKNSSQVQLQEDVTSLVHWSEKWGMTFNPTKCSHMEVGKLTPQYSVQINDVPIPHADHLKYLGLTISHDMKWKTHIANITKKANRQLGMLKRHISDAPSKTKLTAFNAIVRTTLEYASQVWSPHAVGLTKQIDNIHRKAIRWVYRLPRICSITEIMANKCITSLSDRRQELDTKFLRRIEFGDYNISLNNYISFNQSYETRNRTVNVHHRLDCSKYSYFNRMREQVKVYFPTNTNPSNQD